MSDFLLSFNHARSSFSYWAGSLGTSYKTLFGRYEKIEILVVWSYAEIPTKYGCVCERVCVCFCVACACVRASLHA